jgi:hypothetical protein
MGTINIPGMGPVKKPVVLAGLGVIAGILGFAYYRRRNAPSVAPIVADTSGSASVDTGAYDYAQTSDAAGYNTIYPPTSQQYNPYGYDVYGNPLPAPTGATGTSGVFSTNSDWANAAESALENGGVTLAVSTLAISRVLGGLTVTSAQRDYFLQGVGLLGPPPQGYPTPIKLTDSGTGPTNPPPGSPLPKPTGVKVVSTDKTHATLQWSPVTGASHYRVYRSDVSVNVGDSSDTKTTIGGLRSNHTYHLHVRAVASNGVLGAASVSVTAKTKK